MKVTTLDALVSVIGPTGYISPMIPSLREPQTYSNRIKGIIPDTLDPRSQHYFRYFSMLIFEVAANVPAFMREK